LSSELLVHLLQELDAPQHRLTVYRNYYLGQQPISFVSPESQKAIGNRLARLVVNVPKVVISSLAARLRIIGLEGEPALWDEWLAADLDQLSPAVHRTALLYGQSFVTVWGDGQNPTVSVESPQQFQVVTDPATRRIEYGIKRWRTDKETFAVIYAPDRVERWKANQAGASTAAFELQETLDNPLGVVPVARFLNSDLIADEPVSEIADILGLTDALSKLTIDAMTGSEYMAKPRRYSTGTELREVPRLDDDGNPVLEGGEPVMDLVNPFGDDDRFMIAENDQAKFGQLNGSTLDGYQTVAELILSELCAVTGLAPHQLGVFHSNPASAEALKSQEISLTSKAESKQAQFGRSWETVGKLLHAVRNGVSPDSVECSVIWGDPSVSSEAAMADAAMKLVDARILPVRFALMRLGYTQKQIAEIERIRAEEIVGMDQIEQLTREAGYGREMGINL